MSNELFSVESFRVGDYPIDALVPVDRAPDSPLLVMHDGKSLLTARELAWNGQNWGIQDAILDGRIKPNPIDNPIGGGRLPIVVGVYRRNDDDSIRMNELSPQQVLEAHPDFWQTVEPELLPATYEHMGDQYQDFLALELVPALAERYGLKPSVERTAIGGSSMGGFASLYGLARHPEVFGTAFGVSTHWPFGGDPMVDALLGMLPAPGSLAGDGSHRIWIDGGDQGLDEHYGPHIEYAHKVLLRLGYQERDIFTKVFEGANHCEDDWAKRIDLMINWWLAGR